MRGRRLTATLQIQSGCRNAKGQRGPAAGWQGGSHMLLGSAGNEAAESSGRKRERERGGEDGEGRWHAEKKD